MKKCAKFSMIDSKIVLLIATCLTFLVIWMIFLGVSMAYSGPFSMKFFYTVARDHLSENVVVAPASVRSTLAWLYMGAEETTAAEIKIEAQLVGKTKEAVAKTYGKQSIRPRFNYYYSISSNKNDDNNSSSNETNIPIAMKASSRLFIDYDFEVRRDFESLTKQYFDGNAAVPVNFLETHKVQEEIMEWAIDEIGEDALSLGQCDWNIDWAALSVVLNLNTLRGKWHRSFDMRLTHDMQFYVNHTYISSVEMMFQENYFHYGNFPEIRAKGVVLPLNNSTMSMLILMPYGVNDLEYLEETLKHFNLVFFKRKMKLQSLHLYVPKFRFNFNVSLQPILEQIGIKAMFTSAANFSSLVDGFKPFSITDFRHHAAIEINESGIGGEPVQLKKKIQGIPMDFDVQSEVFKVNRPFVFAITDHANIYFVGHVAIL